MAQRYTEVTTPFLENRYLNHEIHDRAQVGVEDESREHAGGQTFSGDERFMVTWRIIQNVAEVEIDGIDASIQKANIRINCSSLLSGQIYMACHESKLILLLASSFSVHVIKLAVSTLQTALKIQSSCSYPVDTETPIIHSSAQATDDFGIVFSLVNEVGQLLAITVQNGKYKKIILQQTSLMSTIWTRVRRSIASGPSNGSNMVASAISDEHPSIYALTKDFQLQQWSIGSWECVSSYNLSTFLPPTHYIRGQMIKFFPHHPNCLIGVSFTSGPTESKIMLLSVSGESGQIGDCSLIADCSENAVISYQVVSDELFILWKNDTLARELIHVSMYVGEPSLFQSHLRRTTLPPVSVQSYEDPRQVFTDAIFDKQQLCVPALLRALHMLDPEAAAGLLTDQMEYSLEELKRMTWTAINTEVRDSAASDEVTNLEYRDLQIATWKKFYVDFAHHYQDYTQPLGIVDGGSELPIALVRKSSVSYIRPCEAFEQQILFPNDLASSMTPVDQDVVSIMKSLSSLHEFVRGFDDHIYTGILNGESVMENVKLVARSITTSRPDHATLKAQFLDHTQNIQLVKDAIGIFIHCLNVVDQLAKDNAQLDTDVSLENHPFYEMNATGRNIVCGSVADMANARYKLCCDLVLYLEYISLLNEEINHSEPLRVATEELSCTCFALLQIYAVIKWFCSLRAPAARKQNFNPEVIEALKCGNGELMASMLMTGTEKHCSLLASFISAVGGIKVKALLPAVTDPNNYYEYLNTLILSVCQAIWPETTDTIVPEFLLASNELINLQVYCRLLEGHCKESAASRLFFLGQTYLIQGVPEQAQYCFIRSLSGMSDVEEDDMDTSDTRGERLVFCYKAMNMLEEMSFLEQVIQMAHEALKLSDSEQPTLFTKLFKHNLELQRYDEAYHAILSNTDRERKMDCLSQFLTALCENGELNTLVSYSYKDLKTQEDMHSSVVSLLHGKARSVDLSIKNYYDLLYAFHVTKGDLLSAANVMHECAERIKHELKGLDALQKRAKCYLACIHALRSVQPKSAWIAPSISQTKYGRSPKRTSHGGNKVGSAANIKISTLEDIEKDYMLLNMALRLASNGCKHITGSSYLDAGEVAGHLCTTGMYDEAIQVCSVYKLSLSPVFESLAFRCLRMSKEQNSDRSQEDVEEANLWLTFSQLPAEGIYSSACDQAWRILRHHLEKHELVSTRYHRAVANKLLANDAALPEWLIASYKRRNVAELLRVYTQRDMIEEAVHISAEYLDALTGHTFESFGLEGPLTGTMMPASVCAPYTSIDFLINMLAGYLNDPYYEKLHKKLTKAVNHYMHELEEKSRDCERRLLQATC
ncbi:nuclear pore complex protein Nup160-like isoform X2 [Watersipora subatra]|uniref:nuclear pore complex protein Nup160-like isoform X2 n=1 Tax=Watersipora subatra TaxID=2589382 RepID=UPI00355BC3AD